MFNTDNEPAGKPVRPLQKGKYVFIDHLKTEQSAETSVPFFSATAISIVEEEGVFHGEISPVKLSDLILKQSSYIDEHGKIIEAHKLYTWPRNLGSTEEWTACKQEFLNGFILHFPIEILSAQESAGVTWRYITPENFKKLPAGIIASASFQEFADHIHEYFFLRRPLNQPE